MYRSHCEKTCIRVCDKEMFKSDSSATETSQNIEIVLKCADYTARMRRLVCASIIRM